MPVLPISAPVVPGDTRSAGHVGAGIPTTDQKVRGSNPFGRATSTQALTTMDGQGLIVGVRTPGGMLPEDRTGVGCMLLPGG
jgi:hypothetical protein